MITEDFVSFEVSNLLKEKGAFSDIDLHWKYNADGKKDYRITHQTAMKWLREIHKISVEIYCIPSYTKGLVVWRYMIRNCETCDEVDYPNGYPAQEYLIFEEAVEAALIFTLKNLI